VSNSEQAIEDMNRHVLGLMRQGWILRASPRGQAWLSSPDNLSSDIEQVESPVFEALKIKDLIEKDCNTYSNIWTWVERRPKADAQQTELDKAIAAAVSQYEQRVRLVADYDKLDEERDALTAQVATLRAALDSIIEYAGPADDTGNSFWQCRTCGWPVGPIRSRRDAVKHAPDCAYIAAKSALPTAPDPNAPSLDDFTHWPFPPEMPPPEGEQP